MADTEAVKGLSGETLQEALEHDARRREKAQALSPTELLEQCVAAVQTATQQSAEFAARAHEADRLREEAQREQRTDDIRMSVALTIYSKRCTENPAASRTTLAEAALADADAFLKVMASK